MPVRDGLRRDGARDPRAADVARIVRAMVRFGGGAIGGSALRALWFALWALFIAVGIACRAWDHDGWARLSFILAFYVGFALWARGWLPKPVERVFRWPFPPDRNAPWSWPRILVLCFATSVGARAIETLAAREWLAGGILAWLAVVGLAWVFFGPHEAPPAADPPPSEELRATMREYRERGERRPPSALRAPRPLIRDWDDESAP